MYDSSQAAAFALESRAYADGKIDSRHYSSRGIHLVFMVTSNSDARRKWRLQLFSH